MNGLAWTYQTFPRWRGQSPSTGRIRSPPGTSWQVPPEQHPRSGYERWWSRTLRRKLAHRPFLARAPFKRHPHPKFRPQRNQRQQLDAEPGLESEPPVLRDRGDQERRLHSRERLPDAYARTAAEWEERELGALVLLPGQPALGPEHPRVGIVSGIAMHRPLAQRDVRTSRNHPASHLDVAQRAAPYC